MLPVVLLLVMLLVLVIFVTRVTDRESSSPDHGSTAIPLNHRRAEVAPTENNIEAELEPVQVRPNDVIGEIYLDIETLRLSSEVPGGWKSIDKFGVAVAITWDIENQYRSWLETDVGGLIEELRRFERIVTYNGDRFDLVVLSGYGETRGLPARSFDVLAHLTNVLGHRVKLDTVASDTLGIKKDGDGLDAVRWWRQGECDRVIEYCKKDVDLLIGIVAHARQHGYIKLGRRTVAVDWSPQSAILTPKAKAARSKVQKAASGN
jgi:DEAD/DEAH box helicase domain-containing protein